MAKKKLLPSSGSHPMADGVSAPVDTSSMPASGKAPQLTYRRSALVQKLLETQNVGAIHVCPVLYGEDAKRVYEAVKRQMENDE